MFSMRTARADNSLSIRPAVLARLFIFLEFVAGTIHVPRVLFQALSPYADVSMVSQYTYAPEAK